MKFSLSTLTVITTLLSLVSAAPLTLKKRNSRWDYGSQKLYGVNLGGWLVLEPFITPSLFEAATGSSGVPIDEYHYCQSLGYNEAYSRLSQHWSTWYTETDFQYIAQSGLNFVRIPVGYWAFAKVNGDPYVQGQEEYLDKALAWCQQYGLKAWIDLHGVPGSQNGFDNSGERDVIGWQSTPGYVDFTLDVLTTIAKKYSASSYDNVVIGIELVNEPLGPALDMGKLTQFYYEGYDIVRESGDVPVIIQDAFMSDYYWDNTLRTDVNASWWDVVVDHHHYQVFSTGELQRSLNQHIAVACGWGASESKEYHWNICGEWSAALTDCAKWLNGAGRGARYDSTYLGGSYVGSCNSLYTYNEAYFTSDVVSMYRQYVEAQLDAFQQGKVSGWVFWCWKTESAVEWDFQRLMGLNIIPQPLDARWFPNQCGF